MWFFTIPYPAVMLVDAAIYLDLSLIGKHNIMHKIGLMINFFSSIYSADSFLFGLSAALIS